MAKHHMHMVSIYLALHVFRYMYMIKFIFLQYETLKVYDSRFYFFLFCKTKTDLYGGPLKYLYILWYTCIHNIYVHHIFRN